jgi:hypothetical protein
VFGDFKAINEDFFSLDVGSAMSLSLLSPKEWTISDAGLANRIVDGLFGVIMATRSNPLIRFDNNSKICRYIAENLHSKIS